MELKELLSYAKRWWWLVLLLTVGSGLLTYFFLFDAYASMQGARPVTTYSAKADFTIAQEGYRSTPRGNAGFMTIKFDRGMELASFSTNSAMDSADTYYSLLKRKVDAIEGTLGPKPAVPKGGGMTGDEVAALEAANETTRVNDIFGHPEYKAFCKELGARALYRSSGDDPFLVPGMEPLKDEEVAAARRSRKGIRISIADPKSGNQGSVNIESAASARDARMWADAILLAGVYTSYNQLRRDLDTLIGRIEERLQKETQELSEADRLMLEQMVSNRLQKLTDAVRVSLNPESASSTAVRDITLTLAGEVASLSQRLQRNAFELMLRKIEARYPSVVGELIAGSPTGSATRQEQAQVSQELSQKRALLRTIETKLTKLVTVDIRGLATEYLAFQTRDDSNQLESYTPNPAVIRDPTVASLRRDIDKVLNDDRELAKHYKPEWPDRREKQAQLSSLLERYVQALQSAFDSLRLQYDSERTALEREQKQVESDIEALSTKIHELEGRLREHAAIFREYDQVTKALSVAQKPLVDMRTEIRTYESTRDQQHPYLNIERFSDGAMPRINVSSRTQVTLIVAVTMFAFSVLFIYLMSLARNRIVSEYDVRRHMNLPVLAKIGRLPANEMNLLNTSPRSPVAETFSTMATLVRSFSRELSIKTLLITSGIKEEGKTSICSNLAIALQRKGLRVLLIDTDVHRPRVGSFFSAQSGKGFLQYCTQGATGSVRDFVVRPAPNAPDLLLAGGEIQDAVQLLESEEFARLIKNAEDEYDIVLFDSPPINRVGDALILASEVDATLVVSSSGVLTFAEAALCKRLLTGVQANILGVVLNNSRDVSAREYYRYYAYGDKTRRSVRKVFD